MPPSNDRHGEVRASNLRRATAAALVLIAFGALAAIGSMSGGGFSASGAYTQYFCNGQYQYTTCTSTSTSTSTSTTTTSGGGGGGSFGNPNGGGTTTGPNTGGGFGGIIGLPGSGFRCVPRRLAVSGRRIGPARLRHKFSRFYRRYKATKRKGRATLFCVVGGGLFWVGETRSGKIRFIISTAPGHRTRRTGPRRRIHKAPKSHRIYPGEPVFPGDPVPRSRPGHPAIPGAHHYIGNLLVGHRLHNFGRVLYGIGKGRKVRFLAVFRLKDFRHKHALAGRLDDLGF